MQMDATSRLRKYDKSEFELLSQYGVYCPEETHDFHHTNSSHFQLILRYLLAASHVTFSVSHPMAFTFSSQSIRLIMYGSSHKNFCQPSVPPLARWPFSLQQAVRLLSPYTPPPIRPQVLGTLYKFSAMCSGIEKPKEGFPVRILFHRVTIAVDRKS